MGYHVCPVCLKEHDEVVLLDRRMRDTLTDHEFAGWQICPEHKKLMDDAYIALIECENQPTGLHDAKRTGLIAHISASAWPHLFNTPIPPQYICFVEKGTIEILQRNTQATYETESDAGESGSTEPPVQPAD
jgi:hypothetical protein